MPQGKCAFCGTFVTSGGTALGKHSVACTSCTALALKWLERHGPPQPVAAGVDEPEGEAPPDEKKAG
ncbi:MAG TPA: hypothetical protein VFH62_00160 [Dehalococcoidia bacterium]|jgi:hypothetical protein|nr:hypothetical protein [Dehalococcoidia bacterium]